MGEHQDNPPSEHPLYRIWFTRRHSGGFSVTIVHACFDGNFVDAFDMYEVVWQG